MSIPVEKFLEDLEKTTFVFDREIEVSVDPEVIYMPRVSIRDILLMGKILSTAHVEENERRMSIARWITEKLGDYYPHVEFVLSTHSEISVLIRMIKFTNIESEDQGRIIPIYRIYLFRRKEK